MLLSAPVLYEWLCMHKHTNFKLRERNFCRCGRLFETIEYILQTANRFESIISNEHKSNRIAILIPIQFRLLWDQSVCPFIYNTLYIDIKDTELFVCIEHWCFCFATHLPISVFILRLVENWLLALLIQPSILLFFYCLLLVTIYSSISHSLHLHYILFRKRKLIYKFWNSMSNIEVKDGWKGEIWIFEWNNERN